jgi:hypothetical protein
MADGERSIVALRGACARQASRRARRGGPGKPRPLRRLFPQCISAVRLLVQPRCRRLRLLE